MIIKASQRANGRELAAHLMNAEDNEHIMLHELTGFVANDLQGAFEEAHAVSKATRAEKYLFSVSLNPPPDAEVKIGDFEDAAGLIEKKLGLSGQPRAMVLHEKFGRLHAHLVYSRIDTENMRAIHLPHFKRKLMDVACHLYRAHEWQLPAGLEKHESGRKENYELAEHQQAKRAQRDPEALKRLFQMAWSRSDSAAAFKAALLDAGFAVARGDRRGFVAVDETDKPYSLSRWCGVKPRELAARLGNPKSWPGIREARSSLSNKDIQQKRETEARRRREVEAQLKSMMLARKTMIEAHRQKRRTLLAFHRDRQAEEARVRSARFAKGLKGLWQFVTGKRAKLKAEAQAEAFAAQERDKLERETMSAAQRRERRALEREIVARRKILERQQDASRRLGRDRRVDIEVSLD
ncbi:MAG TPA: relaxase [Henriciella marina]|uniref:relaxase/mobilization nuclease domain-containing protein n=1 Tax=Henriciella sp. TaxID=1968823 RepID=UPI0017B273A1|nr:hypothetical protein [Henriciella sp.]HIG21752.1 relaxase [Henriciella sp.]HIK65444.1 relaxase [Henriciella marina]